MPSAFVLLKTDVGEVRGVYDQLKDLDGIRKVNIVTGEFDLILIAEADHMGTLMNVVIEEFRSLEGVV